MEFWAVLTISLLVICIIGLLLYILSLRSFLKEIASEFDYKLKEDTNTIISISSGDKVTRELANKINNQLKALRKERLKLQHGDIELKNAITNISHDLRTPLTAIWGYLDLLEEESLSEKSQGYLAIIRERTETMRELTEELFKYSVIVGAEEELSLERVCLNDILEQSIAAAYGTLSSHGITPVIEITEKPIIRKLNSKALHRIFDNILTNAAKYSDGDLKIGLSREGIVTFENTAKDLDSVQTAHLFDRFFTVKSARGGTGLGLSIAKLLTEKMGGSIMAEYRKNTLSIYITFDKH